MESRGSKLQGYPQLDNELEVSLDNGLLPCKDMLLVLL